MALTVRKGRAALRSDFLLNFNACLGKWNFNDNCEFVIEVLFSQRPSLLLWESPA